MQFLATAFLALAAGAVAQDFPNPLREHAADPHIVYVDGNYYMTYTAGGSVDVVRAPTLGGLGTANATTVWKDTTAGRNANFWAPEMHKIDGMWHIFYSAGDSKAKVAQGQRSFVVRGCDKNPVDCEYHFLAELTPAEGSRGGSDKKDAWSIDGTYLTIGDGRYHVVSAHDAHSTQSIQIAKLDTANWTVGAWNIISSPTEDWEMGTPKKGQPAAVNEGPNALYHDDRTWLSFSASWCGTPSYALGLLAYDGKGDPLDAKSWKKTGPALSSGLGVYGTGHNVFFSSPDGKEVWNAYHGTNDAQGSCAGDRYTLAQPISFDDQGNPKLGPTIGKVQEKVPSGEAPAPK